MIDLPAASVPDLAPEWIASRQSALVETLSRRRRRQVRSVALAGASGVAASVSTLILVGGATPSVFAGWAASPTRPGVGQLTSAVSDCQAGIAQIPPNLDKGQDPSTLVPMVSDVRGPYTVTVFGDGAQDELVCMASSGNTSLRWIAAASVPVGPAAIAIDQISEGTRGADPYSLVVGRTGAAVTGVTLLLSNGSDVTATIGNGAFVAWWPGSQSITSAAVTTASGVTDETVNQPSPGNATVCLPQGCGGAGG